VRLTSTCQSPPGIAASPPWPVRERQRMRGAGHVGSLRRTQSAARSRLCRIPPSPNPGLHSSPRDVCHTCVNVATHRGAKESSRGPARPIGGFDVVLSSPVAVVLGLATSLNASDSLLGAFICAATVAAITSGAIGYRPRQVPWLSSRTPLPPEHSRPSRLACSLREHEWRVREGLAQRRYSPDVKQLWQDRALQVASKYGDQAPMATVCCNACRTCVTTNVLALASGAGLAAIYGAGRFARRIARRS
jgi:hypothetical protein